MFILNESEHTATVNSRYTGDLEGGMYAVLDNTRNWNRICEAASLMELKYYNETGNNIWAVEEGALDGFIKTIVEFFKAVIKKIQDMFKQFFALVSSFVSDDKDFVKKYKDTILNKARNLSRTNSIEINGYSFEGLKKVESTLETEITVLIQPKEVAYDDFNNHPLNEDSISELKDAIRGRIVKSTAKMDSSEFRTGVKKVIYGTEDKESITIDSENTIRDYLMIISDTTTNTKTAEKNRDKITNGIKDKIKEFEDDQKIHQNRANDLKTPKDVAKDNADLARYNKYKADLYRSACDDITTAFSTLLQAYKDRNRQARAACVKCLGLKEESAYYGSGSLLGNITIL